MLIINITHPMIFFLLIVCTILIILLAYEVKKSYIVAIPLCTFIVLLIIHVFQMFTIPKEFGSATLTLCIIIDCVFIFFTLISYILVRDVEIKNKKIKVNDRF